MKGLDRKVFLPSGGSLVIDRTEAMTVVDVNTGKYTGTGGNLEETVTRNNLEAAEEIVRQLRLRDLGGIIVIDFIDMVLESNRELVLRRLTECLGRDRTKHQVTEITSLGLVQMTRKRIGQGLLEAFSETCEHCKGRGVVLHMEPIADKKVPERVIERAPERVVERAPERAAEEAPTGRRRGRRGRGGAAVEEVVDEAIVDLDDDADVNVDDTHRSGSVDVSGSPQAPDSGHASGVVRTSGIARSSGVSAASAYTDTLFDPDDDQPAPVEPFVAPTSTWTPPVTKSWVNLGAAPSAADEPAADDSAAGGQTETGAEELESESGGAGGRRRRMSRWRLRP